MITAAAVRKPDLVSFVKDDIQGVRYSEGDREEMVLKVGGLLEVVREKRVTHLVLGAWGCGAYGNPPWEVAEIFRRALVGWKGKMGVGSEECRLVEIVFAIFDRGENLETFEKAFGGLDGEKGAEDEDEAKVDADAKKPE